MRTALSAHSPSSIFVAAARLVPSPIVSRWRWPLVAQLNLALGSRRAKEKEGTLTAAISLSLLCLPPTVPSRIAMTMKFAWRRCPEGDVQKDADDGRSPARHSARVGSFGRRSTNTNVRVVKGLFRISRDDYFWLFGVTLVNKLLGGLFRAGVKVERRRSACPRAPRTQVRSSDLIRLS